MDKISIIIPAYNAEKYIKETIDSILMQTYKNYEIIIINDGSTDKTEEVIKTYKNTKLHYYKQENVGQSAARNNALKYVKGDYIAFIDADDVLKKDCFEELLKTIKKNDSDIAICGYEKFYDSNDKVFYVRNPKEWEVYFDNNIKHVFHYSPCAKLFKTSFIKKFDLKFSEGEQLEDGPYSCLADLLASHVETIDYIGYRYRVYSESTMGNIRKKNNTPKPPYNAIRTVIEKFNKYNKNDEKQEVMEFCVVKMLAGFVTTMYKNCNRKFRKELCSYCHGIMKEYFKDIKKNKYIKVSKLKKLPFSHRMAVRLFIFFDRINMLYPFSLVITKVL